MQAIRLLRTAFRTVDTGKRIKIVDDFETETVRILIHEPDGHWLVHMSGLSYEQAHHEVNKLANVDWQ